MKSLSYRSLIFLTLASFFAGISIGYIKFFILGHLSVDDPKQINKAWVIQSVGALITLGPCITFVIGGPLASAFRKSNIMFFSAISICGVMIFGSISNWLGSGWLYVFLAGLGLGIFNAARNSAIPLEANREGLSTEIVNAWANNLYIVGLLFGVPLGTELHILLPEYGGWLSATLFFCCAVLGHFSKIDKEENHLKEFKSSLIKLGLDCSKLFSHFWLFLLTAPILWGIAGVLSLAATAYVEERNFAGPLMASLMSVYAAFGVVSGNFISTKLSSKRYQSAIIAALGLALSIGLIPLIGSYQQTFNSFAYLGYISISLLLLLCGLFFGCATNLLEAEYLRKIYLKKLEGTGAALMSAMTSLSTFFFGAIAAIGVLTGLLNQHTQFLALSISTCVVCSLIFKLKRALKQQ